MSAVSRSVITVMLAGFCIAQTPEKELLLKIVRERGLPQTLQLGDCLPGTMYVANANTPLTGAGDVQIGATMELPWRFNQKEISAIPAGSYSGHVRQDGDKGWRIELDEVKGRQNVEVHLGNWPKDSIGCILLGLGSTRKGCFVSNSGDAMKKLRDLYASPQNTRPIRVTIVSQ
jgi:hypothetical protein